MKYVVYILAIIFSTPLFAQNTNPEKAHWRHFKGAGYTVNYPSEWEVDRNQQMGTQVIFFSPLSSSKDKFRENVNLIIQDISSYNLSLDQYVQISVEQIGSMITDSKIIENKRIKNDVKEFQKMVYTGKQGKFDLQFEQYFFIKHQKAYILTMTCEQNQFSHYQKIGEAIMNSIIIE